MKLYPDHKHIALFGDIHELFVNVNLLKISERFVSLAQRKMVLDFMILLDSDASNCITETGKTYKTAL